MRPEVPSLGVVFRLNTSGWSTQMVGRSPGSSPGSTVLLAVLAFTALLYRDFLSPAMASTWKLYSVASFRPSTFTEVTVTVPVTVFWPEAVSL